MEHIQKTVAQLSHLKNEMEKHKMTTDEEKNEYNRVRGRLYYYQTKLKKSEPAPPPPSQSSFSVVKEKTTLYWK